MEKRDAQCYIQGVLDRNRWILAKTITLIESSLPADQELSRRILDALMPHTGKALRLDVTGLPGAGYTSQRVNRVQYKTSIIKGDCFNERMRCN